MPVVNIPEVGRVRFPDSMSQEDIAQAASDLYDEKTMVAEREALRLAEADESTVSFETPRTDAKKVERYQQLVPGGVAKLDVSPHTIIAPRNPAEDTYEAQLKQIGITEQQASQAQKAADLTQEKLFPKPVESGEGGIFPRVGAAITRGVAQLSESLNRSLGSAMDWVSNSPVFAAFRGPATGGVLKVTGEAGEYLTDTANRVRETVSDLSLVEQSIPTGVVGKAAADIAGGAVSLIPTIATAPVPGLPILMAGLQTYGSVLGDAEEGYRKLGLPEDQVRLKAREIAAMNGLATSLLTFGFNRFGPGLEKWTEGIAKPTGRNAVRSMAKEFGFEFSEEGIDQFVQGVTARHSYDPRKSWNDIIKESLTAAAAGGVLAFGMKGAAIAEQNLQMISQIRSDDKFLEGQLKNIAEETALMASLPPQMASVKEPTIETQAAANAAASSSPATAKAVIETAKVLPAPEPAKLLPISPTTTTTTEGGVSLEEGQRKEKGLQVEPVAAAEPTPPLLPPSIQKQTIGEVINAALTELKPQDVSKYISSKTKLGGWTGLMWDIGSQAKTPEDVQALRQAAEAASVKTKALLEAAKQPGLTDDQMMAALTSASAEASKQPAEAYEFATGVKLDGTPKWETIEKRIPGYKPPVPDQKYLDAKAAKPDISSAPTVPPVLGAGAATTPTIQAGAIESPIAPEQGKPKAAQQTRFKEGDKVATVSQWVGVQRGTIVKDPTTGELKIQVPGQDYLAPINEMWKPDAEVQDVSVTGAPEWTAKKLSDALDEGKNKYSKHVRQDYMDKGLKLINALRKNMTDRNVDPDVATSGSQPETRIKGSIVGSLARLGRQQFSIDKGYKRANPKTRDDAVKQLEEVFKEAEELLNPALKEIREAADYFKGYRDEAIKVNTFEAHKIAENANANAAEQLKKAGLSDAEIDQLLGDIQGGLSVEDAVERFKEPKPKAKTQATKTEVKEEKDAQVEAEKKAEAAVEKPKPTEDLSKVQSRLDELNKQRVEVTKELENNSLRMQRAEPDEEEALAFEADEIHSRMDKLDYEITQLEERLKPKDADVERRPYSMREAVRDGLLDVLIRKGYEFDNQTEMWSPPRPKAAPRPPEPAPKIAVAPDVADMLKYHAERLKISDKEHAELLARVRAQGDKNAEDVARVRKTGVRGKPIYADLRVTQWSDGTWAFNFQWNNDWKSGAEIWKGQFSTKDAAIAAGRNQLEADIRDWGRARGNKDKPILGAEKNSQNLIEEISKAIGKTSKPEPDKPKRASIDDEAAIEEAAKAQSSKPLESRIGKGKQPDIFEMEDEDLDEFFDAQFGDVGATGRTGNIGRAGTYTFPTYEAFKTWMDARYAERDIDGMRLAFAEAPTPNKKQYLKDNRTSNDHKKAWVASLATGSPLPTEDPPIARTTPRPGPSGEVTPQPRPSPEEARQQPAPPAPRGPTRRVKFDIMALTQLLRMFDKYPSINKRLIKAYGRYLPGIGDVELKKRLLWDTKLAERVLAHEAGHFVDLFLSPQGKGLPFAERLSPLRNFKVYLTAKRAWRNEAKSLSRAWRGPFVNGDPYRDTANELFADFMSAMFNDPEWVNQNFPVLHDAFAELLAGKPSFRAAYEEMTRWLEGDTMVGEWRQQQEAATRKTIEDLSKERPKHRQTFTEWLKGATVSTWYRAYAKEGNPRSIGSALSDDIQYSNMWAAKENELFRDKYQRLVHPELLKIDPDLNKARTILHQYAQARRTIEERRAAGIWIDNNPTEARALLDALLNLDPTLRAKFLGSLTTATNDQLYDLSAEIFREIHDRGDSFVGRMEREIDKLGLGIGGEAALMAFNVRGKLLNPGGLTPENAQKVLDEIRSELSPDQFNALETAAANLRELLYEVQEKAFNEGLISKKTWDELIAPNRDNYVPYAVLDYWGGKVGGGVKQQAGTAKDIANVVFTTQLKVAALNAWRQRQRQVQLLRDIYMKGGQQIPVGERLRRPQDIDDIREANKNDNISRAVLWQDGQPHLVEFTEDGGKSFEKAMDSSDFYDHMEWLASAGKIAHGAMQLYTTFSLPFMLYRNPVRGARTAATRLGFRAVGKEMAKEGYGILQALASTVDPNSTGPGQELGKAAQMALNYARAAFGGTLMPEVADLIDRQVLLPPRLSSAMLTDMDSLVGMIENGGILAFQVERAKENGWPLWNKLAPARASIKFAEEVFTAYEAFEKIYNYHAAINKGFSQEKATGITRRSGIPNPGVGGHFSMAMEVFFPWTRVKLQGLRSTIDTLRDPELRSGYLTRIAITEALPRLAQIAIGAGVISGAVLWKIRPDEDDEDPVMAEVFRRGNPYKMALDNSIPLMLYDPRSGKYHYFNDFKSGKEIPSHYEVVSWRVPSSEEGRTFGPLMYNVMASSPGIVEEMGKPGQNPITAAGNWVANEILPEESPVIQTTENLYKMILTGENPEDKFRKQPSANKELFDAGWGEGRGQAIAGYAMNQSGFPGEIAALLAMNFGILDERATSALKKRIAGDKVPLQEKMPLIKSMLSYDNYSQYRNEQAARLVEANVRAKARLAMSSEVRSIYDFYYKNYERQDKFDTTDKMRFVVAKDFHQRWGKLDDPWSLYSTAAAAVNSNSSKQARETAARRLDMMSLPYVARWRMVSEMTEGK